MRERSEKAKHEGHYFKSHGLQALAIESAEACAEWLHRRIREDWGFPDPPDLTMAQRFTSRYRGKRYSFGYPACPNLEDQAGALETIEAGGDRRAINGRLHDGSRSQRKRTGFSASGLRVFQRGRRCGIALNSQEQLAPSGHLICLSK